MRIFSVLLVLALVGAGCAHHGDVMPWSGPDQMALDTHGAGGLAPVAVAGFSGGSAVVGVPATAVGAAVAAGAALMAGSHYILASVVKTGALPKGRYRRGRALRRLSRITGGVYEATAIRRWARSHGLRLAAKKISNIGPMEIVWQRALSTGWYSADLPLSWRNGRGGTSHRSVGVGSSKAGYRRPDAVALTRERQLSPFSGKTWRGPKRRGAGGRVLSLMPTLTAVEAKCWTAKSKLHDWSMVALTLSQAYGFGLGLAAELTRRPDIAQARVVYLTCNRSPHWLMPYARAAVMAASRGTVTVEVHHNYGGGVPDNYGQGMFQHVLAMTEAIGLDEAGMIFDVIAGL